MRSSGRRATSSASGGISTVKEPDPIPSRPPSSLSGPGAEDGQKSPAYRRQSGRHNAGPRGRAVAGTGRTSRGRGPGQSGLGRPRRSRRQRVLRAETTGPRGEAMNLGDQTTEEFLSRNHRTVLGTNGSNGRPQMSCVAMAWLDGKIEISTRSPSAKVRNIRRDPRVSALILSDDSWYRYVVAYGTAEIVSLPEAGPRLREIYETILGKPHPNWAEFDQAMIAEERVVLRITVERTVP